MDVSRRFVLKSVLLPLLRPASVALGQTSPIPAGVERALVAKGYTVQTRLSSPPLRVNGQPAVAYVIGDMHTEAGNAFTRQAIADLKQLTGVDTLVAEGRSSSPQQQAMAVRQIAMFDARATSKMMSQVELDKRFRMTPRRGEYTYEPYEERAGIPNVFGLEDDHYLTSVLGTASTILEIMTKELDTQGQLPITCDGQFLQLSPAKMFEAFAELRRHFGQEAPMLDVSHLIHRQAKTSTGIEMTLGILTPDIPEYVASIKAMNALFPKHVIAARNVAAARHTSNVFSREGASSTALVIFGRSHLRTTEVKGPTYLDALARQGITTVTLFPGPRQVSFEGNQASVTPQRPDRFG
ncbi:MAG: hypothetical protein ACKVPX_11705 [Myxococcaceae bacterium]